MELIQVVAAGLSYFDLDVSRVPDIDGAEIASVMALDER